MNALEIQESLAERVLGPMLLGGDVVPIAPVGPEAAVVLGASRISDDNLRSSIDVARVRRARLLAPVDTLPDISPPEWAMIAALNDLLQVTNHRLSGPFTRGRHKTLLASTLRLLGTIPAPRSALELLVRYATFGRLFELQRTDTTVSSWAGTERFRGTPPTRRATMWTNLRRVEVTPSRHLIADMCDGLSVIEAPAFQAALAQLVALSPLSDLASANREAPPFFFSTPTVSALASPVGRALALRALRRAGLVSGLQAMHRALATLPAGTARSLVEGFMNEASSAESLEGRAAP
ncbi:MAG: hypothetical protein U0271_27805 [Polyangiaceae bacterium]